MNEARRFLERAAPLPAVAVWIVLISVVLTVIAHDAGGDEVQAEVDPAVVHESPPIGPLPPHVAEALGRVVRARGIAAGGGPPPGDSGNDAQVAAEWSVAHMPLVESGAPRAVRERLRCAEHELADAVASSACVARPGTRDEAVRWILAFGGGEAVGMVAAALDTPEVLRLRLALASWGANDDRSAAAALVLARARAGDVSVEPAVVDGLALDEGRVLATVAEAASWLGPLRPVSTLRRALRRTHSTDAAWGIARALGADLEQADLVALTARGDVPPDGLAALMAVESPRNGISPLTPEARSFAHEVLHGVREPCTAVAWTRLGTRGVTPFDLQVAIERGLAGDRVRRAVDEAMAERERTPRSARRTEETDAAVTWWIPLARVAWERRARFSARLIEALSESCDRDDACLVLAQMGLRRGLDALIDVAVQGRDPAVAASALRALRIAYVIAPDDGRVGDPRSWVPLLSWIRRDGVHGFEDQLVRAGVVTAAEAADRREPVIHPPPANAFTRAR